MARRYVPNTYNNRRFLRIIAGGVIIFALSFVILFLILFFIFRSYVVDGQLEIPWLNEDGATPTTTIVPPETEDPDETGE